MATPVKKSYYTLPYTEFIRTPKNLRQDVAEHVKTTGLLELIKSDGGVRDLVFVLPSEMSIDGKRVIWEGNSRHYCIEQLANDETYQGSLDIPFVIIPKELAENEAECIKFMLSANATDRRIKGKEQWNGVKKLIDIYETNYVDSSDPRSDAVKQVAKELGKSVVWLQQMRRVYETHSNPKVIELLNEGIINSVDYADMLQAKANKCSTSVEDFAKEALDCAVADGKNKITEKYINEAYDTLTMSVEDLLEDENGEDETDQSVKDVEEIEESEEVETVDSAKDKLQFFVDYLNDLTSDELEKIPFKDLAAIAKKSDALYNKFDKVLKKSRSLVAV